METARGDAMNILVVGAGAIGSLFGALLSQQHHVILLGRTPHVQAIQQQKLSITGKTNLRELLILIDNTMLFISNGTGPIHLAGALNKNIIGFYPNEVPVNDVRWKPLSDYAVIFKPEKVKDSMDTIKVRDVIKETQKILELQN